MNHPSPAFAARITRCAGRRRSRISVLRIEGDLDVATNEVCVRRCVAAGPHVVVDLGALRFMDASGFRALEAARAALESRGGSLVWQGAVGEPARFLQILAGEGVRAPRT